MSKDYAIKGILGRAVNEMRASLSEYLDEFPESHLNDVRDSLLDGSATAKAMSGGVEGLMNFTKMVWFAAALAITEEMLRRYEIAELEETTGGGDDEE